MKSPFPEIAGAADSLEHDVAPEGADCRDDDARWPQAPAIGLLVAGLVVFLGYSGGGFFPGPTAIAALVMCLALVLRITLARAPFSGGGAALVAPLALMTGFAVWTLVSAAWSGAPARALLEFDRALLYVLTLAFFGMLAPGPRRLAWGLRGLALGALIVCGAALATRVAPDLWAIAANVHEERLSYPVTYWNALGLLAALGLVVCMHMTTSEREPRPIRVAAAAAAPVFSATLLLTFSRAALLLVPVGLLLYLVLARPRAAPTGLLATVPPVGTALWLSYGADLLATERFDSPAAIAQGHDLALALAICVAAAAGVRALLLGVDDRLSAWEGIARPSWGWKPTLAALLLGAIAVTLALGGPGRAERQWDRFVTGDSIEDGGDTRSRLTQAGNNGRLDHWQVALDEFADDPVVGRGAGTYQLSWARHRQSDFTVNDGHSLYLEVMGELGIVGLALLVLALGSILVGIARRIRGPDRHVHAALLALAVVWATHAAVDWDWEMPVVTLWLFALAGLGLSGGWNGRATPTRGPTRMVRVAGALGVLVLAVTPALTAISQNRLDDAVAAFKRGDCAAAIDAALDSIDALGVRPEPFEVLGYCDVRVRERRLAVTAMQNAVDRDPDSWETHYGLAVVRAVAGLDPRPQALVARRLNPLEPKVRDLVRMFRGDDPEKWKRRAMKARLPIS